MTFGVVKENRPLCHFTKILKRYWSYRNPIRMLREDFKYYFADFVRKGGTPPPLRTKFSPKKRLRIWGVPPPPLRTFPRKIFFKKC